MSIKHALWIVSAGALVGLAVLVVTRPAKTRSLEAAEAGADRRARDAVGDLARRRAADAAATGTRGETARAELARRVYFCFDQAMIRPTDTGVLDEKVSILRANPRARIRIIGHSDEHGGEIYNLALGRRRAVAAKAYLVAHGVEASRIETVSAGEGQPLDPHHTDAAWAKNRRDEFKVMDSSDSLTPRP